MSVMRNRIEETFAKLKEKNEAAFMPFMTLGYPSVEECPKLIKAMAASGADFLEVGVPFSDPLADGPTIQEASQIALKNGMTLKKGLKIIEDLRNDGVKTPILMMGYANPFLAFGIEKFATAAKKAGIDGLIIPDLPPDESKEWVKYLKPAGIDMIFFLAPTTTKERMEKVIEKSSGFIYCISVTGVTGARDQLPANIKEFIKEIKTRTKLPLCIGFGISKEEHVKEVSSFADGAIMASEIIKQIKSADKNQRIEVVSKLVSKMKKSTSR